jgi:eukaryotic-like serine/threonine-protein kinase
LAAGRGGPVRGGHLEVSKYQRVGCVVDSVRVKEATSVSYPQDPLEPYTYSYDPLGRSYEGPPEEMPPDLPPEPPYRPSVNAFATLSVVFAFVFAPAGALFGHLGLAQIRRTGEPGRDRARIGVALSYGFITLAVVALVIWAALAATTSSNPTASSPTSTSPPPTMAPAEVVSLLPGVEVLETLTADKNLVAGRVWDHPSRSEGSGTVDRAECWGSIAAGSPDSYAVDDIAGYKSREFIDRQSLLKSVQIIEAVAAFRDVPAAQSQLTKLQDGWHQCGGTTVKITLPGRGLIPFALSAPSDAGNGITTMDLTPKGLQIRSVRAIAAKANIVIDLYLSYSGSTDSEGPRQAAVGIANYVLGKIPG